MRFALTGSHGVGKTSIISELDDWLSNKGISCIYNSSNARKVKKSGMAINDEATTIDKLLRLKRSSSNLTFSPKIAVFTSSTPAIRSTNFGFGLINPLPTWHNEGFRLGIPKVGNGQWRICLSPLVSHREHLHGCWNGADVSQAKR